MFWCLFCSDFCEYVHGFTYTPALSITYNIWKWDVVVFWNKKAKSPPFFRGPSTWGFSSSYLYFSALKLSGHQRPQRYQTWWDGQNSHLLLKCTYTHQSNTRWCYDNEIYILVHISKTVRTRIIFVPMSSWSMFYKMYISDFISEIFPPLWIFFEKSTFF